LTLFGGGLPSVLSNRAATRIGASCGWQLSAQGVLLPYLSRVRAGDRATEFRSRCRQLGIAGVPLHSYRYAWAERARTVGYQERFAQEALGHNSKAVHRAHAKRALMKLPSLEDYEQQAAAKVESAAA
jgi:integrase